MARGDDGCAGYLHEREAVNRISEEGVISGVKSRRKVPGYGRSEMGLALVVEDDNRVGLVAGGTGDAPSHRDGTPWTEFGSVLLRLLYSSASAVT